MSALRVESLVKHFGGLAALTGVDLNVETGERRAIIGPNGAGKTTLFNLISGELRPDKGRVCLGERDVTLLPPQARASLGLGRTFQRNNLFLALNVFENVRLAVQHTRGIAGRFFRPAHSYADVQADTLAILERLGLADSRQALVRHLSYGQQRTLEVALALAAEPEVLLLDEPTAGMSPAETAEMVHLIETLPRSLTLLIVEHDMDVVFSLADNITVLHYGQVLTEGRPESVRRDPRVQEIYLGADQPALPHRPAGSRSGT